MLNQQGRWILGPHWRSSRTSQTFEQLVDAGHQFLICDNLNLPLPDECCDEVITNSVHLRFIDPLGSHYPKERSSSYPERAGGGSMTAPFTA